MCFCLFFFSSRRRHTRGALVTGVQTCALPISLGRVCSAAFTMRKRNKTNSYSSGRADVAVEVVVNARRVVIFRGEEKHVNSYRLGDAEHDPVEELKRKTPWEIGRAHV